MSRSTRTALLIITGAVAVFWNCSRVHAAAAAVSTVPPRAAMPGPTTRAGAPTTAPAITAMSARSVAELRPTVLSPGAALNLRIPQLHFDNMAMSDVIAFLRDFTDANINVNWAALERAGVSKDTRIEMDLRDIRVSQALSLIFQAAGAGNLVTYYADENIIQITTQELASQKLELKIYPVQDLLITVPDFYSAPGIGGVGGNGLGNNGGYGNGTNNNQNGIGGVNGVGTNGVGGYSGNTIGNTGR